MNKREYQSVLVFMLLEESPMDACEHFIPLSDKQCNVMNLWITEVEKSDAGQDKIF